MTRFAACCSVLFLAAAATAQGATPPAAPGGAAANRSAEREIKGVIAAFRDGDAVAVWNWLPDRFQSDVEELVADFAGRVDPFGGSFRTLTFRFTNFAGGTPANPVVNNPV